MTLWPKLSAAAQDGLRKWATDRYSEKMSATLEGDLPRESWLHLCVLLKSAHDRPEWFPRGKWATLQVIEQLVEESWDDDQP